MALTRGAMIASKAKAKHSFRVEQTAKTSDASLSSTSAMSKHCTHCKGTPSKSAILSTGSPGVSWVAVASGLTSVMGDVSSSDRATAGR
eukprot:jgi/Chrpa1/22147/Chrysochromulina_OHIO_Genome00023462-RA